MQARRAVHGKREGVEQQFSGRETQAPLRGERAVGAQTVERAGLQAGDEPVEDRSGAAGEGEGDFMRAAPVEQAEVDAVGGFREHGDVGAALHQPQAERFGGAGKDREAQAAGRATAR